MVSFLRNILLALCVAALPCERTFAATKKTAKPKPRATPRPVNNSEDGNGKLPAKLDAKNMRLLQEGELPLSARGAIVLDAYTGRSIYEKSADLPSYPASTTKIMTALLVIEAGDLDREVVVTEEDSKVGESSLSIKPGDIYTRRQMLFGLMLKSANDVAHALGRDNAGTAEAFAEKMTRRARELGAMRTSFRNANGLHHAEHYTPARDLATISRAAMQQPYFRQIVSTRGYNWVRPGGEIWALGNHNRMLKEFDGCTGIKTGFTNPAQHTLATAALRDGREVIAAVLYDTRQGKWEDSKLLLTYGMDHPPQPGAVPLRFE
jgi:serine-type D-Ala-D-Ala carboxypeptidase (penicillin-binding protein 5/6)